MYSGIAVVARFGTSAGGGMPIIVRVGGVLVASPDSAGPASVAKTPSEGTDVGVLTRGQADEKASTSAGGRADSLPTGSTALSIRVGGASSSSSAASTSSTEGGRTGCGGGGGRDGARARTGSGTANAVRPVLRCSRGSGTANGLDLSPSGGLSVTAAERSATHGSACSTSSVAPTATATSEKSSSAGASAGSATRVGGSGSTGCVPVGRATGAVGGGLVASRSRRSTCAVRRTVGAAAFAGCLASSATISMSA